MKNLFFKITFLFIFSASTISENYEIQTTSGIVKGASSLKVVTYQDIPYAKPPVGELRWRAPRSLSTPDYLIKPKEKNVCVQRPSSLGGAEGDGSYVGTEDCLYLDITVPKNNKSEKLPVMFWIHGGGNTSGLKDLYDFSKMVNKHNVIVVRINYRLGPFGWFTHPAIQGLQDGLDKSSNFGTLDIIKALEWVQNNISLFGGDLNNVTIFGESAGGHNVLSLIVAKQAKGLFHKAISMSGYTTTISAQNAYKQESESSTSNFTSSSVVERILRDKKKNINNNTEIRKVLIEASTADFFKYYVERKPYEELPLLTADNIVIPKIGLNEALSKDELINKVPTIAGSNADEVKLWLATAEYFVGLDYSFLGSILNIPKVVLKNEDSFEAFNYYRSSAWKIRGVDGPLQSLKIAGNNDIYAYRYDWDDHRQLVIADFKKLIGAAHATEIPLLAGDTKLVGGYPLSNLIYPKSFSKRFTSKNMMHFWTNFAKYGKPGVSTNNIEWKKYNPADRNSNYLVIDNRRNLKMETNKLSFQSLSEELSRDERVNNLEKCVILLQMFTFVGNDLYDKNIEKYNGECNRSDSEQFLIDNASFIEY